MSESTKISIEVEFNENGYGYNINSPAGQLGFPCYDKTPEDRMKAVLEEVRSLLLTCEVVAAKEALREANEKKGELKWMMLLKWKFQQ